MCKWNLIFLGVLLTSFRISLADETTKISSPASESEEARSLSLEECRKALAGYLMETPPASKKELFERIWAGYPERSSADAAEIANGIEGDLSGLKVTWKIKGFEGESEQDRRLLAELIVDGYFNSTGLNETQVQTLKDEFRILFVSQPESLSVLSPPPGLSIPADNLLEIFGYNGHQKLNGVPFAWTPNMCMELAVRTYRLGYCHDAIAIANHGLRYGKDASLLYVRGVAELRAGDSVACLSTMKELIVVHPSSKRTQELAIINDPVVFRFLTAFQFLREEKNSAKFDSLGLLYLRH